MELGPLKPSVCSLNLRQQPLENFRTVIHFGESGLLWYPGHAGQAKSEAVPWEGSEGGLRPSFHASPIADPMCVLEVHVLVCREGTAKIQSSEVSPEGEVFPLGQGFPDVAELCTLGRLGKV